MWCSISTPGLWSSHTSTGTLAGVCSSTLWRHWAKSSTAPYTGIETTVSPRATSICAPSCRRRTGIGRRRLAFPPVRASITSSSGQEPRFGDLERALIDAFALAGVPCEVSVDCFAAGGQDLVHVLVPGAYLPHVHPAAYPSPEQMRRTVLVVTEGPSTPGFEAAANLAGTAAATLVLDSSAAVELSRRGIDVELLRLGYVPAWDEWGGAAAQRSIDLAVLGEFTDRRALAVAGIAQALDGRRTALHLVRQPLTAGSAAATPSGERKHALLADTDVLLCVHGGDTREFDWLSALPAIANGCVVLTEQPTGHGPLAAGIHFETADFHALPAAVEGLLASPDRIERLRARSTTSFVRSGRSRAWGRCCGRRSRRLPPPGPPVGARGRLATPMPIPPPAPPAGGQSASQDGPGEGDMVRAALKQALLRQRRLERDLRRIEAGRRRRARGPCRRDRARGGRCRA